MGELLPDALREVVTRQRGLVTTRQLARAGVSKETAKSRVSRGRWQRMHRGVYATFSGTPDRLAVLYAGPGAMLSYETAAELTKLSDKPSKLIHITIPANRRVTPVPGVRIHHSYRAADARDPRRLPPQTSVDETALDLAAAARTLDDACSWILRALQRRLTAPVYIHDALAQRQRTRWHGELAELLSLDISGLHSMLELRYHRDIEKRHHLPTGTRQAASRTAGSTLYRDTLYEPYATAIELDGNAYHPGDSRWRDIQRDNAAAADGITTLRYSWLDITAHPCQVAAEIARVLARRGYAGARPCSPSCPVTAVPETGLPGRPRSA